MIPVLFFSLALLLQSSEQTTYNIIDFGADNTGYHNSSDAFAKAWDQACHDSEGGTVYVPAGTFWAGGQVHFQGPCDSSEVAIEMHKNGSIVGSKDYDKGVKYWLLVEDVADGLTISNLVIDGHGSDLWSSKKSGESNCPDGATSLAIVNSKHVKVDGLKSYDSQLFHALVLGCEDVTIQNVEIIAKGDSPNTDGIHIQNSVGVTILHAGIQTGDDCISIGPGTKNVWIEDIQCGPGHGISIGSLGQTTQEEGVKNVTVKSTTFDNTQNGLRIKTWARYSTGSVSDVTFQDSTMKNAQNPIVLDQEYCPKEENCPSEGSGVSISGVTYDNIHGSSQSSVAMKFDCSKSQPCRDITLKDIDLTYGGGEAQTSCAYAYGYASGPVEPPSCLLSS